VFILLSGWSSYRIGNVFAVVRQIRGLKIIVRGKKLVKVQQEGLDMQSSPTFTERYLKKVPLRLLLVLGLLAAAILLFVYIVHEVFWEQEVEADNSVFDFLSTYVINNDLTRFMKGVTHFASGTFLQIGYVALIVLYFVNKHWKRGLEIATIGLGGYVLNYVMKLSFQRVRPPDPLISGVSNFSFPSGHATSAFIFYGLLTYLVWKTNIPKVYKYIIGAILLLFSLVIGFSRIYLRVHYTSDVVAGFCIGFAWLILVIWLFERLKKKADKEVRGKAMKRIP
jgi:membrane-associated phospholipid phosphatase